MLSPLTSEALAGSLGQFSPKGHSERRTCPTLPEGDGRDHGADQRASSVEVSSY